jgi:hypothetical protein
MVVALSLLVLGLVVGALLVGARHGVATVLAMAMLCLCAWRLALVLAPQLVAMSVPPGVPVPAHLVGTWERNLFLVFLTLTPVAGFALKRYVPVHFEAFDGMVGAILGIGAGLLAAHLLLLACLAGAVGTSEYPILARSTAVRQLVRFEGMISLRNVLTGNVDMGKPVDVTQQ